MTASFLVLHEARVRRQSILSCTACAACLGSRTGGRRARGETAVCAGAVVRNGRRRRLVRCWARRVRGRHRECRNVDLEPRGDTRRNDFGADAGAESTSSKLALASAAMRATDAVTVDPASHETGSGGFSAAETPVIEAPLLKLSSGAAVRDTRAARVPVQACHIGGGGPEAGRARG